MKKEADGHLFYHITLSFELSTQKLTFLPSFINFLPGGPFPPSPPGLKRYCLRMDCIDTYYNPVKNTKANNIEQLIGYGLRELTD